MSEDSASRASTDEGRRRQVAASLSVGNPANNARHLAPQDDDQLERPMVVDVHEIRPYDANPRRAANERFEEIKASILSVGLRSPLTVTRRPNATHFIIEAGGNTRLRALHQLAEETGEARFTRVSVIVRPWRCESHVLTAHLIENELRGEMTFWDKACGVVALKGALEAERGSVLSLRQFAEVLKAQGLSRDHVTLAHYVYATERLRVLGEGIAGFSGLDVKTMQPRLNALRRYVEREAGLSEHDFYTSVLSPLFRAIVAEAGEGRAFSASATCDACEAAVASRLGLSVTDLLDALIASTGAGAQGHGLASLTASAPTIGSNAPVMPSDPSQPSAVSSANSVSPLEGRAAPAATERSREGEVGGRDQGIGALAQHIADLAGLEAEIRAEPAAPFGFRYREPSAQDAPVSARAEQVRCVLRIVSMLQDDRGHAARKPSIPDLQGSSESPMAHASGPDAASLVFGLLAPAHAIDEALWVLLSRVREICANLDGVRSVVSIQERD